MDTLTGLMPRQAVLRAGVSSLDECLPTGAKSLRRAAWAGRQRQSQFLFDRLEGERLYFLRVNGSDTQWCKNVLKSPAIRIDALGTEAEF